MFSSRRGKNLGFTFRSMYHFELIFDYSVMYGASCVYFIQLFQHLLEKKRHILSPLNCLCISVENQLSTYVLVYFWFCYSVLLIYKSVFTLIPSRLDDYSFIHPEIK